MKIAPKPKEGHEISLDSLLAPTQVMQSKLIESINQTPDGWTLTPIHTTNGNVRMDLSHITPGPCPLLSKVEVSARLGKQGYRLIAADEFYGMLHLIEKCSSDSESKTASEDLRVLIKLAWEDKPFLVNTRADYFQNWCGCIIQRAHCAYEHRTPLHIENFEWKETDIVEKIFGATSIVELADAWRFTTGGSQFGYKRKAPNNGPNPTIANPYLFNWGIQFKLPPDEIEGRTLFVRTTPIEARP